MTSARQRREPPATSRHLERVADLARAGGHVLLRGHLRDDVLFKEEILVESAGLARVLTEAVGIRTVVVANQVDGTFCLDEEEAESFEEFFAELPGADAGVGPNLESNDPMQIARSIRLLLEQKRRPVAVILEDTADLFAPRTGQAVAALGLLLEGMGQADFPGDGQQRNIAIVHGVPSGTCVERIAAQPGVEEVTVEPPGKGERLTAIRHLGHHFYGSRNGGRPSPQDFDAMAGLTEGCSLRSLQQLARASHVVEKPLTRPETLYRSWRGETTETPLGKAGIESIMERLRHEILGQEETLDEVERRLSAGRWRPANRATGSRSTRPMATMVLHGPPGVGKTETAQVIAEELLGSRAALHRIDCAEFAGEHDLARLVGAPPGYVGYEDGGALSEALAREAAVILFDEFDQAPGLTEMLLGVLDAGRLTDGRGRTATFENAVLLFTTNLGFRRVDAARTQLDPTVDRQAFVGHNARKLKQAIVEEMRAPALWSRLQSSLVGYDMLRPTALEQIVFQSCERLERNLNDEFDLRLDFEAGRFASVIADSLPEEADGRTVFPKVQDVIEVPLREQLDDRRRRGDLAAGAAHSVTLGSGGRAEIV